MIIRKSYVTGGESKADVLAQITKTHPIGEVYRENFHLTEIEVTRHTLGLWKVVLYYKVRNAI